MDINLILLEAEEKMELAVNKYLQNLTKIVAGRANPKILENVKVNYYENMTPLDQIASITIPEPRQILIKPYDANPNQVKLILNAITASLLNLRAVFEGDRIRITLPEMTTEKRKELVKSLNSYTEQARVQIRTARQEANKIIKNSEEVSEDDEHHHLAEIQTLTDKYIAKVDVETKNKEHDLMTI